MSGNKSNYTGGTSNLQEYECCPLRTLDSGFHKTGFALCVGVGPEDKLLHEACS